MSIKRDTFSFLVFIIEDCVKKDCMLLPHQHWVSLLFETLGLYTLAQFFRWLAQGKNKQLYYTESLETKPVVLYEDLFKDKDFNLAEHHKSG